MKNIPTDSIGSPTNPESSLSNILENHLYHVLILVVLSVIIYSNSFRVPFAFDDKAQITDNPVIRSLANFFVNSSGYGYNANRFIGNLTFALNYHFGGTDVTGYHALNLAVHIANVMLIYCLVRLTFRTPFLRKSTLAPRCGSLALAAALFFAVHPIQTEAVTYIVQRLASLATMFYLAAIVLHVRWRLASEAGQPFLSLGVLPAFILSLAAALLAMKTKEIAFTLPLIVLLYEFSFFGRPGLHRLVSLAPMLLTGIIIPLSMLNTQKPVGEILSDVSKVTMVQTTLPRWEYLCTQFSVIVTYLRLLFLPINQHLDYDYPINRSLTDPRAILSLFLLVALFSAAIMLWRRSRHGGEPALRLAAFGIFWFFITLMVESSVIPILDVIYEHRVYLPSAGFFIALVTLVAMGVEQFKHRMPVVASLQLPLLVVVAVLLGLATYARNFVWQSPISLWGDSVAKSPQKARPMILLGEALTRAGRDEEAIGLFRRAIQLAPRKVEDYYYNIAVPFNDLGYVLARQGKYTEAIEQYKEAIRLKPDYTLPYVNLAMALADQGRFDEAVSTINYTFRFKAESEEASEGVHTSLGIILSRAGKLDDAIAQYELVLRTNPLSFTAQNNLGILFAQMGRQDEAIEHLTRALGINPLSAEAHFNLGILLARQNRREDAIMHFSEVLKLRPDSSAARQWLEKLRNLN